MGRYCKYILSDLLHSGGRVSPYPSITSILGSQGSEMSQVVEWIECRVQGWMDGWKGMLWQKCKRLDTLLENCRLIFIEAQCSNYFRTKGMCTMICTLVLLCGIVMLVACEIYQVLNWIATMSSNRLLLHIPHISISYIFCIISNPPYIFLKIYTGPVRSLDTPTHSRV